MKLPTDTSGILLRAGAVTTPLEALPDLARLRKWAPSGALALLDQGLISGSNFALAVLLARSAGPEPYGAYMLLFTVFLLIANVYQALVLEPVNVLAFSLFPERNDRYLRSVLAIHLLFTIVFAAVGMVTIFAMPYWNLHGYIAEALTGLIVATPCVLLFWLARCFAYLEFAPARAVHGSIVYCVVLAASLAAATRFAGLSPKVAFLCTAVAALAASARLLGLPLRWREQSESEPRRSEVMQRHWNYGRWGLASVGLSWAQTNSLAFISGTLLALRDVGGLNALVALLLPMFQVLTAATRLSLPRIAQIYSLHGTAATKRPVLRVAVVLIAMTLVYALAVSGFHNPIFEKLYGDAFMPYAWMAPIISLHLIAWAGITACDIAFNSIQLPQKSFRIKVLMVAIMVPVNAALAWRFGLLGAVIGVPVLSTLTALLMVLKLRATWRQLEAVQ